jgi:4-diphosphocytidyl-2-C-methyl-D-erythritol kinase
VSLTLPSYAKINLTLDVFSKRADGYHGVASVMQQISLHDTLTFTRTDGAGIAFTCDLPPDVPVPTDATNLVVRAAQAAFDSAERPAHGIAIHLEKRLPAQAGLGGGSSNAAIALLGTNTLMELNLTPAQLHHCAASLGSDVPFFLHGGTAVARGRGEKITPLPPAPHLSLVIIKPEENVSTGWAYGELDAIPNRTSHRATQRMEQALAEGDKGRIIAFQSNDFELPVFAHYPRLAWLHDEMLMAGALTAHLCGSGSALYAVAADDADAERIAVLLHKRYAQVFTAHTLPSPQTH